MSFEYKAAPALQHRDGGQETETARGRRSFSQSNSNRNQRKGQVRREHFEAVRGQVSVQDAAGMYGFQTNRTGYICCPFHAEKTPSLKLWPDHWRCFGCGEGGSVIDFTAKLFSLSPAEAVRKLDADFHLGLPLNQPLTDEEQQKATAVAARRRFVSATEQEFEAWKNSFLRRLVLCLQITDDADGEDPDELMEAEALALRWRDALDWWWEKLAFGSLEEQITVFDDRRGVERRCAEILRQWLTRFTRS